MISSWQNIRTITVRRTSSCRCTHQVAEHRLSRRLWWGQRSTAVADCGRMCSRWWHEQILQAEQCHDLAVFFKDFDNLLFHAKSFPATGRRKHVALVRFYRTRKSTFAMLHCTRAMASSIFADLGLHMWQSLWWYLCTLVLQKGVTLIWKWLGDFEVWWALVHIAQAVPRTRTKHPFVFLQVEWANWWHADNLSSQVGVFIGHLLGQRRHDGQF